LSFFFPSFFLFILLLHRSILSSQHH
jgi:hypothetical protein